MPILKLGGLPLIKIFIIFPLAVSDVDKICKQGHRFDEDEVLKILEHVLLGLRFLKENFRMIHRDIKPENILK